jgi:hypothetical protein
MIGNIIVLLIVIAAFIRVARLLPKSGCSGDCNQGRSCGCGNK